MFPVKCKDLLPLDHLSIRSLAVRGQLGPLTVWVSNEDYHQREGERIVERRVRLNPAFWTKLYDKTHACSRHVYKELVLDTPIKLRPGETKVLYIHSTLPGDEAIVYDNSYYGMSSKRYEDDKLAILTGRAHVSTQVFGQEPIWGWGNAWRDRREFVGRLEYGAVYKLWNPHMQPKFGNHFQDGARLLFMCQRRWESPWSLLPDECIFYILNMCRWDWFDDDSETMRQRRKREKSFARLDRAAAAQREEQQQEEAVAAVAVMEDTKPTSCAGRCKSAGIEAEDDDQMDEDSEGTNNENENEDDDDDYVEDDDVEDDDVEGDEEEADSDDAWSDDEDQYHRASIQTFSYRDADSDDEEHDDAEDEAAATSRRDWIRRNFARIHVLRALAQMEDSAVAQVNFY
jgi:hypothetical protein